MDKELKQLENYLRQFQPRRPRPLPPVADRLTVRRVAAGLIVFAACVGSLWLAARSPIRETNRNGQARGAALNNAPFESRALLNLALEDPAEFDAALTAASRQMLPRFDGESSTLRVLAKE
jgi:hypothetical protein